MPAETEIAHSTVQCCLQRMAPAFTWGLFLMYVFFLSMPHRPSVLCRGPAETEVSDSTVHSVTFSAWDQLSHGVYFWCFFFLSFPHRSSVLCRGPAETEVSDSTVQCSVHGTSFHYGFIFGVCFSLSFPHRPSVLCGGPAEVEVAAAAGAGQPGEPAGWRACQAAGTVAGAADGRRRGQAE